MVIKVMENKTQLPHQERFNLDEVATHLNLTKNKVLELLAEEHMEVCAYNKHFKKWLKLHSAQVKESIGLRKEAISARFVLPDDMQNLLNDPDIKMPNCAFRHVKVSEDFDFLCVEHMDQMFVTLDQISVTHDALTRFIESNGFFHNHDYSIVRHCGKKYTFNPIQAEVVRVLHSKFQVGECELHEKDIFKNVKTARSDNRMDKVFRTKWKKPHPALGTLIVKIHENKPVYKLAI